MADLSTAVEVLSKFFSGNGWLSINGSIRLHTASGDHFYGWKQVTTSSTSLTRGPVIGISNLYIFKRESLRGQIPSVPVATAY